MRNCALKNLPSLRQTARVVLAWTLLSTYDAALDAQERFRLEYLPIQQVHQRGLDPMDAEYLEFLPDGSELLLGKDYGLMRYSVADKTVVELGGASSEELKPLMAPLPDNYRYLPLPRQNLKILCVTDERFFFNEVLTGSLLSTTYNLTQLRLQGKMQFSKRNRSVLHSNGQAAFLIGFGPSKTVILLDSELKPIVLCSGKPVDDLDEIITGNTKMKVALRNEQKILLGEVIDGRATRRHMLTILPQDEDRYVSGFFANHDEWLCLLFRHDHTQAASLDYYSTATGTKLGKFNLDATFPVGRHDKCVGTDRGGELLVLTTERHAMLLKVRNGQFEKFVDDTFDSRINLLSGRTPGRYAVSPDGRRIAVKVRRGFHEDVPKSGMAMIEIADIERIRLRAD